MFKPKLDRRERYIKKFVTRFETDLIRYVCWRPLGGKEVIMTGGGGVKWNAGNRTLLDFNFVKKKITEESEDIYQSDEQGKC